MKNKLLTGGAIALILCLGGLFLTANPNMKPGTKPPPETKPAPETKKPEAAPTKEGDLKAKKAMNDAFDKRNKSKGFHFSGTRKTNYVESGFAIPAEFNGVKNNTDNLFYMVYQTSIMGSAQKFELYQKGDKKYTRNVATEERAEGKAVSPIMQGDRIKDDLEGYKFGKEEKLNERDQTVIEAVIKDEGVNKLLADLPKMGALPAEAKITCDKSGFKIWVDKKTSLISKMSFFIEITAAMPGEEPTEEGQEPGPKSGRQIYADIDISEYNKDVEITVPDEIKEVMDAKEEPEEKE